MASNELGWFPVYVGLWQGESVKCLSLAAQGAYMACITAQFKEGSIPADLTRLARVIGADRAELEAVWPEIADKFSETEPGRLANSRMTQVKADQEQKVETARINGSKGGRTAKPKENPKDNPVVNHPVNPEVNHPVNPDVTQGLSNPEPIREEKNREEELINTTDELVEGGIVLDATLSPAARRKLDPFSQAYAIPTLEVVIQRAAICGQSEDFARGFFAENEARDWCIGGKPIEVWTSFFGGQLKHAKRSAMPPKPPSKPDKVLTEAQLQAAMR
jgi:uncharacterized protein YdaU (DUF1376 family)